MLILSSRKTMGELCAMVTMLYTPSSVVLVWLHIIRFSFSTKEENLVLVLVSKLKVKKVTKSVLVLINHN